MLVVTIYTDSAHIASDEIHALPLHSHNLSYEKTTVRNMKCAEQTDINTMISLPLISETVFQHKSVTDR
jgi:hypothetical protein